MAEDATPDLSIVMTVVDGGETLVRCLEAIEAMTGGHEIEVLIPYDHISREVGDLSARFPAMTFIDQGEILGGIVPADALQMHKFYDTRRSAALDVARGRIVGILEDRGRPTPDWASQMLALHDENPHGVIGGAIMNGEDKPWNWAIFFCDFSRYQAPIAAEDPEYVSDTNITYKRDAIMAYRHMWEERYVEAELHWAMRRGGEKLMISDRAVTWQHRPDFAISRLLGERFNWARMYGRVRGVDVSLARRLALCAAMPALPLLLLYRHGARQRAKGHHFATYLRCAPRTLLLLAVWSAGEFTGYLEAGRAGKAI